jgi:hypothetical protein
VSAAAVATSASTSALPSAAAAAATAATAASGSATAAAGSLADRLLHDWSGATSRLLRLDAAQYAQVFKLVRPLVGDIVALERDLVERYLAHRTQGLRAIVTTAYAYRVDAELTHIARQRGSGSSRSGGAPPPLSSQQLPGHLKRVLLALHEEKRALQQCLGALSVDTGHNRRVFRQMKRSVQEQFLRQQQQQQQPQPTTLSSPLAAAAGAAAAVSPETGGFSDSDQDEHDDDLLGDGDGDGNGDGRPATSSTANAASSNGGGATAATAAAAALSAAQQRRRRLSAAANTRYAHYLHQQLCQRLLDAVEDVVGRLYAGQFGVLAPAASVASNPLKPSETQPENPFKQSSRSTTSTTSNGSATAAVTAAAAAGAMVITTTPATGGSSSTAAKVALSNLPVASILQAAEDLEFLKTVLRPLLLDTQVLQKKPPLSSTEVQQLQAQVLRSDGGVEVVSSDLLLQWGQLLVVLIQQQHQ